MDKKGPELSVWCGRLEGHEEWVFGEVNPFIGCVSQVLNTLLSHIGLPISGCQPNYRKT